MEMEMDDEGFEDLLAEAELLQDSSQESLTGAVANSSFADHPENPLFHSAASQCRPEWSKHGSTTIPKIAGTYPNAAALDKIECAFEEIADALLGDKDEVSIALKSRRSNPKSRTATLEQEQRPRRISFPGKSPNEAWRFAVVIRILELMHEALRDNVVYSKRDIYYRDPALFGSQSIVDRYVDDIAFTFGLSRSALNITAAAKGLIAGPVTFYRTNGSSVNAAADRDGILVPNLNEILSVDMETVKWIIVIEKEASFRSIAASSFWNTILSRGVIITGKGYPDLATRALLHFLGTASPRNGFATPKVYGLADFDPDGVAILCTYKYGSQALAHENEAHCVPHLQWLGLRSEHLRVAKDDIQAAQGLLPLTDRDRKKAIHMLGQDSLFAHCDGVSWRSGLQAMLALNLKAELQLLDAVPNGMANLLLSELGEN